MKRILILLATMGLSVLLFASAALAQQGGGMGQENEMQPNDHMMQQGAMMNSASAMSSPSATATASPSATASASPTASATATPTTMATATATPTTAASMLPDTGGPSLATPIALAAALALVGSGVGTLALVGRRDP
jgi:hypothetical protein